MNFMSFLGERFPEFSGNYTTTPECGIAYDAYFNVVHRLAKDDFFNNPDARQPRTKDFLNKILQH